LRGTRDALVRAYLRLQNYLAHGLLVEEVILGLDELGALYTSECSDGWALPHALRIRDLCMRDPRQGNGASRVCPQGQHAHELLPHLWICRRPDNEFVLLDNAGFACKTFQLRGQPRARLLRPGDFLARVAALPSEFFGTMREGIPYQSIYLNGEELIQGRRTDLNERLDKVRSGDLLDKSVLDLGCNIGVNCFLAVDRGARSATGIDLIPFVTAATRLNGYYDRPCRFQARDLNDEVAEIGEYDTVFVFALVGHLNGVGGLLGTIRNARPRAVYIETHCDLQPQGDLHQLLGSSMFSNVVFLGHSRDNVVRPQQTRHLYRCEVTHEGGHTR
jgi:hypothetical protein